MPVVIYSTYMSGSECACAFVSSGPSAAVSVLSCTSATAVLGASSRVCGFKKGFCSNRMRCIVLVQQLGTAPLYLSIRNYVYTTSNLAQLLHFDSHPALKIPRTMLICALCRGVGAGVIRCWMKLLTERGCIIISILGSGCNELPPQASQQHKDLRNGRISSSIVHRIAPRRGGTVCHAIHW